MFIIAVELLFSLTLIANALLFIPQIVKIYRTKNIAGISLIMFVLFELMNIISTLYGYVKNDHIFFLGSLASVITCGVVTIQIIFYQKKRN